MMHGDCIGHVCNEVIILMTILTFAVIAFIVLIRYYLDHKNNPEFNRIMEILKQRYVKNEIEYDDFYQRMMIIEHEDIKNPALLILMERYANGEMDSQEFCEKRNKIRKNANKSVLHILKERHARCEITTKEFRQMKK